MSTIVFGNNANSTLASPINNTATTIVLALGTGAKFPSPGAGQYFVMTLNDTATGLVYEIVHCTARSGDTLTVSRGQEGTTAVSWLAGDITFCGVTAGMLAVMAQSDSAVFTNTPAAPTASPGNNSVQLGTTAYADLAAIGAHGTDIGSANVLAVTLAAGPTWAVGQGMPIRLVKSASVNTGAATLNINSGGALSIIHADGTGLAAGELPASGIFTVIKSGSNYVLQSVGYQPAPALSFDTTVANGQFTAPIVIGGKTFIMKFGTYTTPSSGNTAITFAAAFPNAAIFSMASSINNTGGGGAINGASTYNLTTTGVEVACNQTYSFSWLAIGY